MYGKQFSFVNITAEKHDRIVTTIKSILRYSSRQFGTLLYVVHALDIFLIKNLCVPSTIFDHFKFIVIYIYNVYLYFIGREC